MNIIIETSGRHIHLSKDDLEALFGRGYELTKLKDLSQPGVFAAKEKVKICTEKHKFEVRLLGPTRELTQVEISKTDSELLGLEVPEKLSGDLRDTPGIKVVGPAGEINLSQGVIKAKRHIHLDEETAKKYGARDGQEVSVKIKKSKEIILENTIIRVSSEFKSSMHIDVDEAKEAGIKKGETGKGKIIF